MHLQQQQHYTGILIFPNFLAAAKLMGWLQCIAGRIKLDREWYSDDLDVSGWSITSLCSHSGRGRAGPALHVGGCRSGLQPSQECAGFKSSSQPMLYLAFLGRKVNKEVFPLFWAFFLPYVQGLSIDKLGGQLRAPQDEDEDKDENEVWGGRRHRKASRKVHNGCFSSWSITVCMQVNKTERLNWAVHKMDVTNGLWVKIRKMCH